MCISTKKKLIKYFNIYKYIYIYVYIKVISYKKKEMIVVVYYPTIKELDHVINQN